MSLPPSPSGSRLIYLWAIAADLSRQTTMFAISVVLARLLTPGDYGLVGMVWTFLNILTTFQYIGATQSVIQFGDDPRAFPLSFKIGILLGAGLTLLLFASAGLIAGFYRAPPLIPLVQAMSVTVFLSGLRAASNGWLMRQLRFRRLALVEGSSSVAAAVIAVWMAWRGYGPWALVAHQLITAFLIACQLLLLAPPRLYPTADREFTRSVVGWTLPLLGSGLLWGIWQNADQLVVGRTLGAEALGYYSLGYRLATLVSDRLGAIVNRVSFSKLATMRDDRSAARAHWFAITGKMSLVAFPTLTLLGICGEDVITLLMGARWAPATIPLRYLCVVGILRCIGPSAVNFLATQGHSKAALQFSLQNALVMTPAFYAGCKFGGVNGVGLAWVLCYPWLVLYSVRRAIQVAQVPVRDYLLLFRLPVSIALALMAAIVPVQFLLAAGTFRLVSSGLAGCAVLGVFWRTHRGLRAELLSLAGRSPAA